MMTLIMFLLTLAGFALLSASMVKHHRDLFGAAPSKARKRGLAAAGWALLAASVVPAFLVPVLLDGICLWLGVATPAALAVAMALTYLPATGRPPQRAASGRKSPAGPGNF